MSAGVSAEVYTGERGNEPSVAEPVAGTSATFYTGAVNAPQPKAAPIPPAPVAMKIPTAVKAKAVASKPAVAAPKLASLPHALLHGNARKATGNGVAPAPAPAPQPAPGPAPNPCLTPGGAAGVNGTNGTNGTNVSLAHQVAGPHDAAPEDDYIPALEGVLVPPAGEAEPVATAESVVPPAQLSKIISVKCLEKMQENPAYVCADHHYSDGAPANVTTATVQTKEEHTTATSSAQVSEVKEMVAKAERHAADAQAEADMAKKYYEQAAAIAKGMKVAPPPPAPKKEKKKHEEVSEPVDVGTTDSVGGWTPIPVSGVATSSKKLEVHLHSKKKASALRPSKK